MQYETKLHLGHDEKRFYAKVKSQTNRRSFKVLKHIVSTTLALEAHFDYGKFHLQ